MGEFIAIPITLAGLIIFVIGAGLAIATGDKRKSNTVRGAGILAFVALLFLLIAVAISIITAFTKTGLAVAKNV